MTTNPVVFITGSAGGIGRALVQAFSDEGYYVIGLDLDSTPEADHSLVFDLDRLVTEELVFKSLNSELESALNGRRVQVLINNAALQVLGSVNELTVSDFRSTLNVNLVAPFALVKLCLPHLVATGGSVINIGSIHGRLTKPCFSAYATSKGALETFTRALAVELGSKIRVNGISPAAVETPMLHAGFEDSPEAYNMLADCHPAGRIARPREIAELAVFLAGDKARFINGAIMDINGGIGCRLHDPG